MYGTYHMTDPEVFYNKEDLWSFPQETVNGKPVFMQPYYTIMRLPGEAREEFILMLPMVPNNRDNMIAWLAARCDGAHYGEVLEFAFSKDKLVYGPAQIEARIDQDTTISQQLSLWNQIGSRVIRGNLLVIPIEDAVLYVEPLYLSAAAARATGIETAHRFVWRSRGDEPKRRFLAGRACSEGSRPTAGCNGDGTTRRYAPCGRTAV